MYKQDSEKIKILRTVEDSQTGIREEYNVMKKWGCLFASLLYIVEKAVHRQFSPSQIKLLFEYLVAIKAIRKDIYVKNHRKVLYHGCRILGYEPKRVEYLAKIDYENDSETWGDMKGYTDYLMEERIDRETVHFLHKDFNPYDNLTGMLISKRYYKIDIE